MLCEDYCIWILIQRIVKLFEESMEPNRLHYHSNLGNCHQPLGQQASSLQNV
jgi:hypothetical protein